MIARHVCSIIGILLFLVGSSIQARPEAIGVQPKTVFDPWELGPFIEGDEVPPKDMVILLKAASVAPEGSTWLKLFYELMESELDKRLHGLVRIKLYAGGVMGDEADTIRKMKMKQLHIVGVTNMGLTMLVPEMCVFELPFLFDWEPELYYSGKYCEVDYVFEKLENSTAKLCAEKGIQFLGFQEAGFCSITSKFPIRSVEDLKKLKFFVLRQDRIRPEINLVFGFRKTTSTEIYDIASMLSTGMVDSALASWYASVLLQWWPHVKYATDYPVYGYETSSTLFDKRVLDRVVAFAKKWGNRYGFEDFRDIARNLLELTDRAYIQIRFATRQDEAKARKELIERGAIEEVHFPEGELEKLRQKVLPLYDKLADKKYPRWLLEEILKYREEYRKLKAAGKLTADWYERGILPEGDQHDQWRTEWEHEPR